MRNDLTELNTTFDLKTVSCTLLEGERSSLELSLTMSETADEIDSNAESVVPSIYVGNFAVGDLRNAKQLLDGVALLYRQEGWATLLWEFLGYLRECSRKCGTVKEFVEYSLESAALPVPSDSGIQSFRREECGPAGPANLAQREIIHMEVFELGSGETRLASVEGNTDLKVNEENPLRLEIDLAMNQCLSQEQSGKLECIYVIAKMRPHFLICCGAESPASMEDLPPWKFEDRVETFSTKDPALAFSGQKAAQPSVYAAIPPGSTFALKDQAVPGSDQLASLPLNETSILAIGAKNCSEVPLLLQSMSIEVDDGIERPCTLEHSGMDILHPAHLVPGEEFKKVFTVIHEVESSCLDLGSLSLRWRRNSEMEDLSTSAATQEWVLTKHKLPDVKAELPPLVLNLEFPPYAVLGDPLIDIVFVLPKSEHALSYKLVPLASGPQQLPQVTVISARYSAAFQPSNASSTVFVFPSKPQFKTTDIRDNKSEPVAAE
ncbi:hypothetical protein Peur_000196 [Populus x canadensis]